MRAIDTSAFVFSGEVDPRDGMKVVDIVDSFTTKQQLLDALAEGLQLPNYFGANWDALDECLRDLSWLPERSIVIEHDSLSQLADDVLRTYLDILARAGQSWRGASAREFRVTFAPSARKRVEMLATSSSGVQ
jgi:RNAse (barnase) inhibitor barstar